MPHQLPIQYRRATVGDAEAIASLHAESWRRNYRGAYSDDFLDGDVHDDRRRVWTTRLADPSSTDRTVVATADAHVVGFAHVVPESDPTWGALLENLHVTHDLRGGGIGTQLLALSARTALDDGSPGLFLWVLEQNVAAQAFCEARGGTQVERGLVPAPGGVGTRLAGTPTRFRYVWTDPTVLFGRLTAR